MTRPATLILDGIWGRPRRFHPLRDLLRERCGRAEIYRYSATGLRRFEELGAQLAAKIETMDGPVDVVAFSMGGIVLRTAHLFHPTLPLRRTVFLNSPHKGSWLAYALPFPGVRQLRPSSPLMRQLDAVHWPFPTLNVWCPGDLMVLPGRSALLDCASEILRCDVPLHTWPIWSRSLRRRIVEFLNQDEATYQVAGEPGVRGRVSALS
jgi:triacylglycerol lipase